MRSRIVVGLAVVSAFALGCRGDDFLTPLRLRPQTQFVLRSAQGNSLPVTESSDARRTAQIVADTLTLQNNGRGERRTRYLIRTAGAATDSLSMRITPLDYRLSGTRIEVKFSCPAGYFCSAVLNGSNLWGEVTRSGIRFDRGSSSGYLAPLEYDKSF